MRARIGTHLSERYRVGIEGKWLDGRNYRVKKQGLFVAMKMSEKLRLELNAGREFAEDRNNATYAGIAISSIF